MTGGRWSRRGGRPGDRLLLVGSPGYLWGAAVVHHGGAELSDSDRNELFTRARTPRAQVRAALLLAARGLVRAAIDISDGLYAGVRLLCAANSLGAMIEPEMQLDGLLQKVCEQAGISSFQLGQTWGDWTLLVAVRPDDAAAAESVLRKAGIGVRDVGRLTEEHGVRLDDGSPDPPVWRGMDQERFTDNSWHGDGILEQIERMQQAS